jgi:hypothetical protein
MLLLGEYDEARLEELEKLKSFYEKGLSLVDDLEETTEVITNRRIDLVTNLDLDRAFRILWQTISVYVTDDGVISEEGYLKFHTATAVSLLGSFGAEYASSNIPRADYLSDTHAFGPLYKDAFFDAVLELIGCFDS